MFTKGLRRGKSLVPTELRPVARDKDSTPGHRPMVASSH